MKFTKMHGTGNDYIFVNCLEERVDDAPAVARAVSDRHFGVGADGLILIHPSQCAAVRMEMYNADGSRAQMCGNGIRCVAKYAYERGLTADKSFLIETDDGVKVAECSVSGRKVTKVRIDMGVPRFGPSEIPVTLDGDAVIDVPVEVHGRSLRMTCVSMGNPHAVFFVDSFEDIALEEDGSAIEGHSLFPERVNVHFVEIEGRHRVGLLTWERGSGRTLACGTGAAAVCAAGARTGRTGRSVTVRAQGGELELEWADDNHVYMTGPAVEVFRGTWLQNE
ncbi:MAG: diaminopimelate epimerase [Phycisphaerae bacterium]